MLHGRLGHIESARDGLVALAPHHEGKHFHLAFGKAEIGRRYWASRDRLLLPRLGPAEGFGRNVDAARKYQTERIHHHIARSGFWNEAKRTEIESPDDVFALMEGRQHHQRNRSVAFAQIAEHGKAVPVR